MSRFIAIALAFTIALFSFVPAHAGEWRSHRYDRYERHHDWREHRRARREFRRELRRERREFAREMRRAERRAWQREMRRMRYSYRSYDRYRDNDDAIAIVGGLMIGAIIGSALREQREAREYFPPPPPPPARTGCAC